MSVSDSLVTSPTASLCDFWQRRMFCCLRQVAETVCGAHSATRQVRGPGCNNSGQSAEHSSASNFEVKDVPVSFILMLRFARLLCTTYVFCYCGTWLVTLQAEQSIVTVVRRRSVLENILRKRDKVGR